MPRPGFESVVLVTGFPSQMARRMVREVLSREPRARLSAVVLSKFAAQARAAVAALAPDQAARVELLDGDAAAMDLGLSGAEYMRLAREVDRIHHVAYVSYPGVDARVAQANVLAAAEIVELGRTATNLRCLVFHSTAQVAGDRSGVVYESELDAGQGFRNVVEETRMRAESIARVAMARVPIAIVRPTAIVGDS
ncbi:MAG TPA: SDR family oxidoreductase, partial [Byssovorax sp.]